MTTTSEFQIRRMAERLTNSLAAWNASGDEPEPKRAALWVEVERDTAAAAELLRMLGDERRVSEHGASLSRYVAQGREVLARRGTPR